jgi:hypothetical protein
MEKRVKPSEQELLSSALLFYNDYHLSLLNAGKGMLGFGYLCLLR